MCDNCRILLQWVKKSDEKKDHDEACRRYRAANKILRELVYSNRMEFVAGNCAIEDTIDFKKLDDIDYFEHYFRCKCGEVFNLGAHCRGRPFVSLKQGVPGVDYKDNPKVWDRRIRKKFGTWRKSSK